MPPKMSKEIVNQRLQNRPVIMIGDYKLSHIPTTFKCLKEECGHEWPASPSMVIFGTGCPKCKVWTKEEINNILTPRNITMIGDFIDISTNTMFKCLKDDCAYEWPATSNNLIKNKRPTGCPKCAGNIPLTIEIINEKLKDREMIILEYNGALGKSLFKCLADGCNNIWPASTHDVLRKDNGTGCPNCRYKNETRIRKYLKEKYGEDQGNRLTVRANNRKYYIDYVVNGIFIEYNGRQHYQEVIFFGTKNNFIKQQKRDQELRDYCLANNIRLIEIPYWLSHEEQYKLLDNLIGTKEN